LKINQINRYIDNFRKWLTPYIKPNVSTDIDIYNCGSEGALLVVNFKPSGKNREQVHNNFTSISKALQSQNQSFISGDSIFQFHGTNLFMDPEKIFIIKEDNYDEWTDRKSKEDVEKIINKPSDTN